MPAKKNKTKASRSAQDAQAFLVREFGPLTFGGAMSGIRSIDGATLAQFAKRLGVSAQHLSDVEKDRRGVSAQRAAEWARVLGHPPAVLVRLALQREVDTAGLKLRVRVWRPRRVRNAQVGDDINVIRRSWHSVERARKRTAHGVGHARRFDTCASRAAMANGSFSHQ